MSSRTQDTLRKLFPKLVGIYGLADVLDERPEYQWRFLFEELSQQNAFCGREYTRDYHDGGLRWTARKYATFGLLDESVSLSRKLENVLT